MPDIGTDLLDIVVVANPLGPGDYTFQVRTGTNVNRRYAIDIIVEAPEPATLFLMSLGLGGLGIARRRTSAS